MGNVSRETSAERRYFVTLLLPQALRPWESVLSLFPEEVALTLGDMVRSLSIAIGPFRTESPAGDGEPDGFDGLTRKGTPERLLLTEWGLSSVAPEEFLRKMAMNEASYLKIARTDPAKPRWTVLLFDAGPTQLGAPRLAHIAAWVLFAQRATRAKAKLRWGVLQRPAGEWREDLTQQALRTMLAHRSGFRLTSTHLESWLKHPDCETNDLWVVTDDQSTADTHNSRISWLRVSENYTSETPSLIARCQSAGKAERRVELPIPEQRMSVRLIRDPFETNKPTPTRANTPVAKSRLLFCDNGRRVIYVSNTPSVIVQPFGNSPRAPAGKPCIWPIPPDENIASVFWRMGRLYVISGTKNTPCVTEVGKRGGTISRALYQRDYPWDANTPLTPWVDPVGESASSQYTAAIPDTDSGQWSQLVARDGAGHLVVVPRSNYTGYRVLPQRVFAMLRMGKTIRMVASTEANEKAQHALFDLEGSKVQGIPSGLTPSRLVDAHFGYYPGASSHYIAGRYDGDEWCIVPGGESHFTLWMPGGNVVGSTYDYEHKGIGLVVVDDDGKTVRIIGRTFQKELTRTDDPIESATVDSFYSLLGWVSKSGALVVYSLAQNARLLQLLSAGGKS